MRLADRPRDLPRTPLLQVDATKKIASAPSPSSRPTWVPRLGSMIVPIRCDASGFSEREAAWAMSRNRWREWMRRRPPLRFRALGRPGSYPGRKTTPGGRTRPKDMPAFLFATSGICAAGGPSRLLTPASIKSSRRGVVSASGESEGPKRASSTGLHRRLQWRRSHPAPLLIAPPSFSGTPLAARGLIRSSAEGPSGSVRARSRPHHDALPMREAFKLTLIVVC